MWRRQKNRSFGTLFAKLLIVTDNYYICNAKNYSR
jgi:hypothetical protein